MENLIKYENVFCETLQIEKSKLEGLQYQGTEFWDSVGHMTLIAAIEDTFDIMMEVDDIIEFSSYQIGIEILKSKYGIQF
jgi:acyl carrier protein